MNRRSVLKLGFILAVFSITGISAAGFLSGFERGDAADNNRMLVGCITDSPELEALLAARSIGQKYNIIFARSIEGGLAGLDCSAFVIDRSLISTGQWQDYADYLKKSGKDTPIVVVDDIGRWS